MSNVVIIISGGSSSSKNQVSVYALEKITLQMLVLITCAVGTKS